MASISPGAKRTKRRRAAVATRPRSRPSRERPPLIRRERRQVSKEVYKVADLVLDTGSLRATRGGRDLILSPIALRLLGILMRESPRVVSRRDIEREMWGDELPESDTLRSHLYNLRKAVDRDFSKQLLHTVQTAGYRIVDLDEQPKA